MEVDDQQLNNWLIKLHKREKEDLIKLNLKKEESWTEEVIIPQIIFEKLSFIEKQTWEQCDVSDIYSAKDIENIFGVKSDKLNKCFSKKFFKLTIEELEEWERIGQNIKSELPINDILIIYTE